MRSIAQNQPPRRTRIRSTSEHGRDGDGHEDDRERVCLRDVQLAGPAEEAKDRDGQRRSIRAREEDGGAELAERDREREPGGHGESARDDRQVDLTAHSPR